MSGWKRLLPGALAIGCLAAACGAAPASDPGATRAPDASRQASPSSAAPTPAPSASAGIGARLAEDLDAIDRAVRSKHPAPFTNTTEAAWVAKLAELRASLPAATPDVAMVQLQSLIGLLDTHSFLAVPPGGSFPIVTHRFADGFFITGAVDASLVGSRIDAIDGTPIDEVEAKIRPLIAADNESGKLDALGVSGVDPEAERRMGSPNVLHGLGIIADPAAASFSITRPNAMTETVSLEAVPGAPLNDQLSVTGGLNGAAPTAVARRNEAVWTELDAKHKVFLFSVNDMHETGIPEALTEMAQAIADRSATRVILDLRYARGGSSSEMDGLVAGLATNKRVNRPGGLVVLIGREDVSASTTVIAELDAQTSAVFVGEATPARADNFLNPESIELPASGWRLVIPTFSWHTGDPRPAIDPDVAVPPTAADFFAGRDATLRAALAYRP